MSVMGTRVRRVEDPRLLTVGGTYVADVRDERLAGAAHAVFVRSPLAHGRILEVETDEAAAMPGVLGVFTAADVDLAPRGQGDVPDPLTRPWLAHGVVRFVGEPVAVVVAETPAQAVDAAELVFADLEPLPAVVDVEAAATDEVLLFPEHGTNVVNEWRDRGGDDGADDGAEARDPFADCEVVVSAQVESQRLAPCPLEVRSTAAAWTDGPVPLTVWVGSQSAHGWRGTIAEAFELDPAAVHVITPDVGGGFGARIAAQAEDVVVCWLARRLDRPVRSTDTRSESMVAMPHGRGQRNRVTLGGTADGELLAYRLEILQDGGAYRGTGAFLPFLTRMMAQGTYDIPHVECTFRAVVTTTTPTDAYRGAGRPEATHAIERAVDLFAAEAGLDPVAVRRRNLIPDDAFPYTTRLGTTYDSGRYREALDRALARAGYDELRAEQAARRQAGDPVALGIGVCCYVEVTAGPFAGEREYARIEVGIDDDGVHATVYTGASAHGQGHDTSFAMLVADALGIPLERVRVVHGDTALVPDGVGTYGSRSLQVGGSAVRGAAEALVAEARARVARLFESDPDTVEFDADGGRFRSATNPDLARTWADLAADGDLVAEHTFVTEAPSFPFGAHVAVVEVDTETGTVRLRTMVSCDDAGVVLNPVVVEGQRHGGLAQGIAQALTEAVTYDDDGTPRTANLADYGMISAPDLPDFELEVLETPTPLNALGAKGVGESGTIGSTPAVHNAVVDALAPYGIRNLDLPCTPARVWAAVQAATAAGR